VFSDERAKGYSIRLASCWPRALPKPRCRAPSPAREPPTSPRHVVDRDRCATSPQPC